jgi:SPP1 family predicted phage head-tail adaptor
MMAGSLRKRVAIETVGSALDDYGDLTGSWTTLATVWASIDSVSGTEREIASELVGIVTHRVKMRYRSAVNSASRLIYDGRTFEVESVTDWQERGIFLELLCKEVTP